MSGKTEEFMKKVIEEGMKDLIIDKPFRRAERLDTISASILQTVGVILTILAGVFSLATERGVDLSIRMPLLVGCLAFLASMIFLVESLRSREVIMPSKITQESYFALLDTISKINDRKKRFQNIGLVCLVIGAVFASLVLLVLTFIAH